ncbi:MAG: iron ABC transporter permease [Phycisphaeraceae bacterium]|nr:iron ABC transporter permease [Phycisphaeraceae bacterium]
MRQRSLRNALLFASLVILLGALVLARLYTGDLPGLDKFRWPSGIVLETHVLLIVKAALVGAALAMSGVALQSLLRNVLAEPFILGLSSGAAAGLMVQYLLQSRLDVGNPGGLLWRGDIGALLGSAVTMSIVMLAGRRNGALEPLTLLLVGVVVSMINGAIIMVIRYMLPLQKREDISFWLMGRLDETAGWTEVMVAGSVVIVAGLVLIKLSRAMDAAAFSDLEAVSLGVRLERLRVALFLIATATAGAAVMLAGPLGFVGLVCPHLARLLVGPRHRVMLPAALLLGACLVIGADLLVRLVHFGQGIMPVGIFTVAIGAPVFIWMLKQRIGPGV